MSHRRGKNDKDPATGRRGAPVVVDEVADAPGREAVDPRLAFHRYLRGRRILATAPDEGGRAIRCGDVVQVSPVACALLPGDPYGPVAGLLCVVHEIDGPQRIVDVYALLPGDAASGGNPERTTFRAPSRILTVVGQVPTAVLGLVHTCPLCRRRTPLGKVSTCGVCGALFCAEGDCVVHLQHKGLDARDLVTKADVVKATGRAGEPAPNAIDLAQRVDAATIKSIAAAQRVDAGDVALDHSTMSRPSPAEDDFSGDEVAEAIDGAPVGAYKVECTSCGERVYEDRPHACDFSWQRPGAFARHVYDLNPHGAAGRVKVWRLVRVDDVNIMGRPIVEAWNETEGRMGLGELFADELRPAIEADRQLVCDWPESAKVTRRPL